MVAVLKFIRSSDYDFTNDAGERVQGVSCQCFEPVSKKIVKVKTDVVLDFEFGDDVEVNVELNGDRVNYILV